MTYSLSRNISIKIEPRPDRGIRVWSPQVRGLILSGVDPVEVMACIWPALAALEEHRQSNAEDVGRIMPAQLDMDKLSAEARHIIRAKEAKIEFDAKVIAALREVLAAIIDYQARYPEVVKMPDHFIVAADAALSAADEQEAGK